MLYTHLINISPLPMSLCQAGGYPAADSLTVTSFPQLGQVLASMHDHAGEGMLLLVFSLVIRWEQFGY
jgi:hypothetical protein